MIQTPIPRLDSIPIHVPLPTEFERWRDLYFSGAGEKLLVFVVIAAVLYVCLRIARRQVDVHFEDVNKRHSLRKWIGYSYIVLLILIGAALFADQLAGLGAVIAVVLAGIAIALQDVLRSFVGWLYISTRGGIQIGSRIEVMGVLGDVIDIGVLKTTVMEVGNLIDSPQSTGRLVTIPNSRILSESVVASAASNPFVWQELSFVVPFDSDWQRGHDLLLEIGEEIHARITPDLERGFMQLERRYAFKYGKLTPIVYVTLAEYGVRLTLRFLVHVRNRRGSVDAVTRRLLEAFENEPNIRITYPTQRLFMRDELTDAPQPDA